MDDNRIASNFKIDIYLVYFLINDAQILFNLTLTSFMFLIHIF